MISKSKISIVLLCCFVICLCSVARIAEPPDDLRFSPESDRGYPSVMTKVNSLKSGFVIGAKLLVPRILGGGAFAKILASIVQGVVIAMIPAFAFLSTKNLFMHCDVPVGIVLPLGIETLCASIPVREPTPLREPVEVIGINDCSLPLSQSNVAIGCMERLNNCVPWQRRAGHVHTSNVNVFSVAILAGGADRG